MKKRKNKKGNLKKKLREEKLKKQREKMTTPVILDLIERMIQMIEKDLKFSIQQEERKFLIESVFNEYKIVNEDVSHIKTETDFRQVMSNSYKRFDDSLKGMLNDIGAKITCSKGCGYCCHQLISITFPTLSMIFPHITEDTLENAHKFIEDEREFGKPCIFLKNNSCSIYAARPFPCRGYFSVKPALECKETYVNGNKILSDNMPALVVAYGHIIDSITDVVFDLYGYQRIFSEDMISLIVKYGEDRYIKKWLNKEEIPE